QKDDQIEDTPQFDAFLLDHPPFGEELGEIAAHRPIVRRLGRAEVDQQHADATGRAQMLGELPRGIGRWVTFIHQRYLPRAIVPARTPSTSGGEGWGEEATIDPLPLTRPLRGRPLPSGERWRLPHARDT